MVPLQSVQQDACSIQCVQWWWHQNSWVNVNVYFDIAVFKHLALQALGLHWNLWWKSYAWNNLGRFVDLWVNFVCCWDVRRILLSMLCVFLTYLLVLQDVLQADVASLTVCDGGSEKLSRQETCKITDNSNALCVPISNSSSHMHRAHAWK